MAVAGQHVYDSVEVAVFHVEFNNTAVDLLDVDHVGHFRSLGLKPGWEDGIYCYGLQQLYKPVHSLIYADVAANKVQHAGIGKPRL
jgi:hypothetical protein